MNRESARRDDEALLASIYRRYSADVSAYALRRCRPDDAADVVAETFVVAWRRIQDVPEEPAVKPWLLGVARRVLANQRRGIRRRSELVRKVSTYLVAPLQNVSAIEQFGEAQMVVDALKQLSSSDQELLMLVAWEELTPSEVATTLGVSGATVRKRLFRARKRLADVVAQLDVERLPQSGHLPSRNSADFLQMGKGVPTP